MSIIRIMGTVVLAALLLTQPTWGGEPPKEPRPAKHRVDLYGDPLPKGAVVRFGSLRFRHPGAVWDVAFSPDGKLLAASSGGHNMVILWERATGRKIREITLGTQPGMVPHHLRFSADGKRLYACSSYRTTKVYAWDIETGRKADVPPFPAEARTLGYSPDSKEMILLHRDREIVRWDINKGEELGRYPKPGSRYPGTAVLVGERLLVPKFDGQEISLWDVVTNKRLWSVKTSPNKHGGGKATAFSADGKLCVAEAPPGAISVFESVTGKPVRRLEGFGKADCLSLSLGPDGRTVAAAIGDDTLRLWDVKSGRQRAKVPGLHISAPAFYFAPGSKVFATGGPNNPDSVLLWDAATCKQIDRFPGHDGPVAWVSFSPDGQMAATCSWIRGDMVVRQWETRTGVLLRSFVPDCYGRGITTVAFSPDGETLAASEWDGEKRIHIWDVRTGRELHALMGHVRQCTCVAFSPDGKRLASGDNYYDSQGKHGGRLCIWDAKAGKLLREIRGTRGAIQQVLFSGDGRRVVAAANGVYVYDADTGRLVGQPFQTTALDQKPTRIWRLALSADGRLLATADGRLLMRGDGRGDPVRLWELATLREIPLTIPGGDGIGVALSPDGRTLAASGSKGGVVLFHWPSGKTVGKLSGSGDIGAQVFFSPDGRRLATADNSESTALIWDVADSVNQPLPAVAKPTVAERRRWWDALRDDNPAEAYKAVWRFVATPEQALPFLAKSLRPIQPPEPAVVARLIGDLDSDKFAVREKASQELSRLDEAVVGALQKAKNSGPSLEQRKRIDRLLDKLAGPAPSPEQLRTIRAVAVLEQIGDAEARKILARLAAGATGARLTREAQAGLERFKKAEK